MDDAIALPSRRGAALSTPGEDRFEPLDASIGFGDRHRDREGVGVAVLVDGFAYAAEWNRRRAGASQGPTGNYRMATVSGWAWMAATSVIVSLVEDVGEVV